MVDSLKPQFKDKVLFLTARLDDEKGRAFAKVQRVGSVTLILFKPDGTKISVLTGVRPPEFLQRILVRSFGLEKEIELPPMPSRLKSPSGASMPEGHPQIPAGHPPMPGQAKPMQQGQTMPQGHPPMPSQAQPRPEGHPPKPSY